MVFPEDPSLELGTRRAADIEQKASEVGLRCRLGIDPETLSESHRDERAVQPVLERYTDTEVRGQRQRSDQFGGADALRATSCSFSHVGDDTPPRRSAGRYLGYLPS